MNALIFVLSLMLSGTLLATFPHNATAECTQACPTCVPECGVNQIAESWTPHPGVTPENPLAIYGCTAPGGPSLDPYCFQSGLCYEGPLPNDPPGPPVDHLVWCSFALAEDLAYDLASAGIIDEIADVPFGRSAFLAQGGAVFDDPTFRAKFSFDPTWEVRSFCAPVTAEMGNPGDGPTRVCPIDAGGTQELECIDKNSVHVSQWDENWVCFDRSSSEVPYLGFEIEGLLWVMGELRMEPTCINPEKALLLVKKHATDFTKDKLKVKMSKFDREAAAAALGDPVSGSTGYHVRIFADSDVLWDSYSVMPNGQTTGTWATDGKKVTYKNSVAPITISKLLAQSAVAGKGVVSAAGRDGLSMDALATLTRPVRVVVSNDTGNCWETVFSESDVKKDDGKTLKLAK